MLVLEGLKFLISEVPLYSAVAVQGHGLQRFRSIPESQHPYPASRNCLAMSFGVCHSGNTRVVSFGVYPAEQVRSRVTDGRST